MLRLKGNTCGDNVTWGESITGHDVFGVKQNTTNEIALAGAKRKRTHTRGKCTPMRGEMWAEA